MNGGTPKSIPEFVRRELTHGPLSTVERRLVYGFKDYLAQSFSVAMLKHENCVEILKELFDRLTKDIE